MDNVTLPPDIAAALNQAVPILRTAKDTVNEYTSFAGPPGRYYARLRGVKLGVDRKTSKIKFSFLYTCLAKAPDAASDMVNYDQSYAGMSMRTEARTQATDNQTEAEAWARAMQALQAHDVKTANFGIRDGKLSAEHITVDLWAAICALNAKPPAMIVDVVETPGKGKNAGKTYKNVNPREVVKDEVVARFGNVPTTPVDDKEFGELEESTEVEATVLSPERATELIEGLTEEVLRQELTNDENFAKLNIDISKLSFTELKEIAIGFLTGQITLPEVPPFETAPPTPPEPLNVEAEAEAEVEAEAEAEPEVEEEVVAVPDRTMAIQMYVANLTRDEVKKGIRTRGGRLLTQGFFKTETDEALKQELVELLLGTRPAVAPLQKDEIPF